MRIASYNVENLFNRAKALNQESWAEGREVLETYSRLNAILQKQTYSQADKQAILEALKALGLEKSDDGPFAMLRQNRGRLVRRPTGGGIEVVADGRGDWIGWVELEREAVNEAAIENTARVIRDIKADVLGVVEAEDRTALLRFNDQVIKAVGGESYDHVMLIDGNDERGIDVGIMMRNGIEIASICSHVDDRDAGGKRLFSRDCPEYLLKLPSGANLRILVNHLKSKGYGKPAESNARRKAQALRVREIYDARRASGEDLIAIVGDMNDTPDSDPLSPLLGSGSDLKDVSEHPNYQDDGRPGTYGNGTKSGKIDYILLSPALFAQVQAAGVNRTGVWGGKNGTLWPKLPELTKEVEAASDHAAIWADLNI
ncbi:endonuclease/exonuclease/phosphatase family protein [Azospirillum sp.]|uniref:endonuclease/exonuclease/phosphatase family protein n=1 Tax=Azospirillum sp. TaxID=34012 RepID=UPI003D738A46